MQRCKEETRTEILRHAARIFRTRGFAGSSMREIADAAHVCLSNIYNYFPGKDAIFRAVVRPATLALEKMLQGHHGQQGEDVMSIGTETYLQKVTSEYVALLGRHRTTLELLFFRAQGSSLENYRETYTDRSTALVRAWLDDMKRRHPRMNAEVSDFSIHLHTVWMFTLFEEIIMHRIKPKDTPQIVAEYIRFETTGWRELMKL